MIIKRLGTIALSAMLVAGLAACKKDKKDDGQAKASGSGEASASGSGTGTASGSGTGTSAEAPKTEGGQAMAAIKGAIAKTDDEPKHVGMGGIGAALGGLFAGGGANKNAAVTMGDAKPTTVIEGDEAPPPGDDDAPTTGGAPAPDMMNLKLPPPGPAGGGCAQVADRIEGIVVALYTAQVGELDAETKKMVEAQMASTIAEVKTQMLDMCTSQHWPQNLMDCVITSADMTALQGCEQYVTEDMKQGQGGDAEPAEPPPPATPAPAWTGGDDCAAVGERIVQLAMNQAGELPDDQKKMMQDTMAEAQGQLVDACTQGNWSADQRTCFLKAGTIQDAEVCFSNIGM